MNDMSKTIFDVAHVVRNLRDTLQFLLDKEQTVQAYDSRKKVLTLVLDEKSILGKFLKDNEEKTKDFKAKFEEFLKEVYGEDSTILFRGETTVRVDHGQNNKILEGSIYLSETLRDILLSYETFAKQKEPLEQFISELIAVEERVDRVVKTLVLIQEYQKKFMEFQKVMTESQGKPTPQSNYIVQNELNPIAAMIRFVRSHAKCIDNKTLDKLDDVIELLESCEGRRERRDNRSFPDLFHSNVENLGVYLNEIGANYDKLYQEGVKEMIASVNAGQPAQA